ncbi:hypothetical protein EVAR_97694_1 [Eumeta japonica]|uniref:Regulatory protein zeste n=1 Tax=Eumeta variegata TaxID=151549 RepID=A0A4C1WYM2_EUMVA|nr:hypothetical protein EVAR_97694_1 [Eumeta japonica]
MESPERYRRIKNFTGDKKDAQDRWKAIANELNSLKGSRKEWQAWRKTWQDMRAKAKKRHAQMVLEETLKIDGSTSPVGIIVEEPAMSDHNDTQEAKIDYLLADAQDDTNPDSPERDVSPDPPVASYKKKSKKHVIAQKKLQQALYTSTVISEGLKQKNSIKLQLLKMKKQFYAQYIEEMRRQTEALREIAQSIASSSSRSDMMEVKGDIEVSGWEGLGRRILRSLKVVCGKDSNWRAPGRRTRVPSRKAE